jgi:hypothetical protein
VLDNQTHASTGGQRTISGEMKLESVARAAGLSQPLPRRGTSSSFESLARSAVRRGRPLDGARHVEGGTIKGIARVEPTPPELAPCSPRRRVDEGCPPGRRARQAPRQRSAQGLLSIEGKTLLERHLANMADAGITTLTIVVGFEQGVDRARSRIRPSLPIELIENPDFVRGSILSLQVAAGRRLDGAASGWTPTSSTRPR